MPKREAGSEKVHQRRQALLNLLQSEPEALSIKDLAQRLGLQEKTVSYDMRVLSQQSHVHQTKDYSTRPARLFFRIKAEALPLELKPAKKPGRPAKGQTKAAPPPAKTRATGKTQEIDQLLLRAFTTKEIQTVHQLSQQLGKTQAHVNQALARLMKKGKVNRNRDGKKYLYTLAGHGPKQEKAPAGKIKGAGAPPPASLLESNGQPEFIKAAIDAFVDRILDAERRAWTAGKAGKS